MSSAALSMLLTWPRSHRWDGKAPYSAPSSRRCISWRSAGSPSSGPRGSTTPASEAECDFGLTHVGSFAPSHRSSELSERLTPRCLVEPTEQVARYAGGTAGGSPPTPPAGPQAAGRDLAAMVWARFVRNERVEAASEGAWGTASGGPPASAELLARSADRDSAASAAPVSPRVNGASAASE